jgi:hypothetical protein
VYGELLARGCRFVLTPYGGDSTRAVATAHPDALVWNHGAAADDVQRLPGVVSVPSPASRYLVALGRAVAALRPGASVAVVPLPMLIERPERSRPFRELLDPHRLLVDAHGSGAYAHSQRGPGLGGRRL